MVLALTAVDLLYTSRVLKWKVKNFQNRSGEQSFRVPETRIVLRRKALVEMCVFSLWQAQCGEDGQNQEETQHSGSRPVQNLKCPEDRLKNRVVYFVTLKSSEFLTMP